MRRIKMSRQQAAIAKGVVHTTIDVLSQQIAVIDEKGLIVAVNAAWLEFAAANGGAPLALCTGANYLEECDRAAGRGSFEAAKAAACIRSVIVDHAPGKAMEYECNGPNEQFWFRLKITRSRVRYPPRFLIEHEKLFVPKLAADQIRLQANILASVEQAIIATDLTGVIVYWNPFAERLYGWSADNVLGKPIVDITPTDASQAQALEILSRLQQGESWSGEFEVRHRGGWSLPIHVTNSPMRDENNQLIGIIGISMDITARKMTEKALVLSNMVYHAIGEAIMIVSIDGRIVAINSAFSALTAYSEAELVGQPVDLLKSEQVAHFFLDESQPLLEKTGHWAGTIWTRRKEGELVQEWMRIDTIYDESSQADLRVCMFSPVTDQKRANETIWQQANFDALTGLPNRSMFRDRLEQEIKKAEREAKQIALMFIDLDQFKDVNDTLGHDFGDYLLKQAAQRLELCARATDTVARIGGDEFTMILGQLEDASVVDRVARNIVQTMAQAFHVSQNTIYVSASVGITLYPEDARDAETLIKNADQAMYAAKNNGRNQFHYFTHRMQRDAQARMRITNDLRDALANHQFEVVYQPIVELATGAIHKAEALLRWRHPQRGMVDPAEFIAIAEQTGLITAIGDWVCGQAATQAAIWRKAVDPLFQISVNMSPMQLRNRGADSASLPAQCCGDGLGQRPASAPLIIEVTEGLLLETCDAVVAQLRSLHEAGVELAIDNFGTGHSALSYLRKFHVDYLKIDRAFVTKLVADSDDLSMCEAIIVMAHKLGIKVIAEGIEKQEQRELLTSAGCDYGQGYLFTRPISAEPMGRLLMTLTQKLSLK